MKQKLLVLLFVCALVFSLTGCGDKTAEVSLNVPTPTIGETVDEYLSGISVTANETKLIPVDTADATYGDGTKFTAEVWCGYEAGWDNMLYDTFIEFDPKYNALMYYGVCIRFAVPAEYTTVNYTADSIGVIGSHSEELSEDGKWRLCMVVVAFDPLDDIDICGTYINIPTPVFGETVAQENEKITVTTGALATPSKGIYDYGETKTTTTLTYTDSTDYDNPDIYENGTKFAVEWMGPNGGVDTIDKYDTDHVFSEDDRDEAGNHYYVTVSYAVPAEYVVDYATSNETVWYQPTPVQTEEWVIHKAIVIFSFPEQEQEQRHSVVITAPDITVGETVAEANAGVSVTLDGVELAWVDGDRDDGSIIFDSDTEFCTVWCFRDTEEGPYTGMTQSDMFTNDIGRTYELQIYYATPSAYREEVDGVPQLSYDCTFVTGDGIIFNIEDKFAEEVSARDDTHMNDRAEVDYVLHDHVFTDWATTVQGNCTKAAEMSRTCTVCGYEEGKIIEPSGHTWSAWVDDLQATCTTDGTRHRTCTTCRAVETRKVAALGHSYTYTRTVGNYHKAVCSRCGDTFEEKCTYNNGSRCIYCGEIIIVY